MKILFLHGYQSQPGGIKPTFLRSRGHEVLNPALPSEDFEASVRITQQAFDQGKPDVVIGSSRGGALAMSIDSGDVPLVLIAPAWKRWGTATTVKGVVTILHSPHDDLIPIEDSRELLRNSGLSADRLLVVGANHNMVDEAALGALLEAVKRAVPDNRSPRYRR